SMIIAEVPYEVTEPTIDSQVARLKASGADIFMNFSGPKFAAQAIRKIAELGWKPLHFINIPSSSIGTVLKPAGLDISQGIITGAFLKDVNDPAMAEDPGVKNYRKFLAEYYPDADLYSPTNALGYVMAQVMIHVLREAGDDLTRENIMHQASTIKDLEVDMLLPSIKVNTTPEDFAPLKTIELRRFVADRWQPLAP
ncbi:MAG: ABC transporter substrate-binding protein, partial [Bradyrhizobium sp.]|nr:ABC transporter substrate-binding protein [Bradyrhizobium sp.]